MINQLVSKMFIVFPYQAGKGMAGLDRGLLIPIFVVFLSGLGRRQRNCDSAQQMLANINLPFGLMVTDTP